jgi:DUF218 domain
MSALFLFVALLAPPSQPAPRPLPLTQPITDKNFYFLSLLSRHATTWSSDPILAEIGRTERETLRAVFRETDFGKTEAVTRLILNDEIIAKGETALASLYDSKPAFRNLIDGDLRRSGAYYRFESETGANFVRKVWRESASGINQIIKVYAFGTAASRTPSIDAPFLDFKLPLYGGLLHTICGVIDDTLPADAPFFAPSLRFATEMLIANRRDEAGRHEPMELGVNAGAYRRARSLNWSQYPYTVLLLPGYGPEEPGVSLSPIGKLALQLAAQRYRKGMAPFILVSGGYVHPAFTPYSEAIEMKRYLIDEFKIPENAIIVDPHARHTTTNLRNAARLMFRYGIPVDRWALVVTNSYQSADIASTAFADRCRRVFGYVPHDVGKRLGPFDLEFRPRLDSLTIDPGDPLDP